MTRVFGTFQISLPLQREKRTDSSDTLQVSRSPTRLGLANLIRLFHYLRQKKEAEEKRRKESSSGLGGGFGSRLSSKQGKRKVRQATTGNQTSTPVCCFTYVCGGKDVSASTFLAPRPAVQALNLPSAVGGAGDSQMFMCFLQGRRNAWQNRSLPFQIFMTFVMVMGLVLR